MKNAAVVLVGLIALLSVSACNPDRWDHVDVQQISYDGSIAQEWKDVKVIATWGNGLFQGGTSGVRFETKEGKQVSLMCPHRFLYR